MAVAVRGVGELEGDEGVIPGLEHLRAAIEQLSHQTGADQLRQELPEDHPLVVPGCRAPRIVEDLGLLHPVVTEPIDDQVVGSDEAELHLAHEQVRVVALIPEQGDSLVVPGNVVTTLTEQQLRRIVLLEEVWGTGRPGGVDDLEVGAWRSEVLDAICVCVMAQRGAVGGDVMSDELAEERPACGHLAVGRRIGVVIADAARAAEGVERLVLGIQGGQGLEQASVATAVDGVADPLRRQALIAGDQLWCSRVRSGSAGSLRPPEPPPRPSPRPEAGTPRRRRRPAVAAASITAASSFLPRSIGA